MIVSGTVWLIRDKSGREVFASTRMTPDWEAKLVNEGHEVFEFPFELPSYLQTIPAPPPSTHGCYEPEPEMDES